MKRLFFLFMSIMLILLLTACGNETQSPESSSAQADQTPKTQRLVIVSKPESSSADPSASEESSDSEAPVVQIADMTNMNLLTGLTTLSEEAIGKRPVAVMVNNIPQALPQYGISDADILFEIPVEADITRLMAVYGDYTKVPNVCSIRSCRYYFPILAVGFDAFYVHCGTDPTVAKDTLYRLGVDRIDGAFADYGLFQQDQSRLNSGYAVEHTLVFYGTGLPDALENDDVRIDLKEDKRQAAFLFAEYGEEIIPDGEDAESINVFFSGYSDVDLVYNTETGTYDKMMNGAPHMDAVTGRQLSFDNVLLLETSIGLLDNKGRKEIDIYGGSDTVGYYASKGKIQKIHWEKSGDFGYLSFTDLNGNPVAINRGKTYIAFDYPDRITYQ